MNVSLPRIESKYALASFCNRREFFSILVYMCDQDKQKTGQDVLYDYLNMRLFSLGFCSSWMVRFKFVFMILEFSVGGLF